MHAAGDRLEFAPPQPPGLLRAFVLAVIAHLLLLLALTYGLRWQRETPVVAAEAELWSQLPQEAAPRPEPVAPPPPPPPAPPQPVVKAPPLPDPQVQRDAQIALEKEREKEKREAAEKRQAELEKERDRKRKLEAQRRHEEEVARQKQEKLDKQEQARLLAEAKKKEEDKKKRLQEQQEKKLAQMRDDNMKRMQAMAGSGAPSAAGAAPKSSGPSTSWAGRVQARVRPNIVFTDDISGNPKAEVEVRTSPDGTIVGKRLVRSSGSRAWDDAVLRALDKTEVLPRDVDGRVPSPVIIDFRPKG